jgi:hypothetical protein
MSTTLSCSIFFISIALLPESCDCFSSSLHHKLSALLYGLKRPDAFFFSFFCLDGDMWLFVPMVFVSVCGAFVLALLLFLPCSLPVRFNH